MFKKSVILLLISKFSLVIGTCVLNIYFLKSQRCDANWWSLIRDIFFISRYPMMKSKNINYVWKCLFRKWYTNRLAPSLKKKIRMEDLSTTYCFFHVKKVQITATKTWASFRLIWTVFTLYSAVVDVRGK